MITIINGKVIDGLGNKPNEINISMDKGVITHLGKQVPVDSEIIDAKGRFISPGLIESHCTAGLTEHGLGWEGRDADEASNPMNSTCNAIDGINPRDPAFNEFIKSGITTIAVFPGNTSVVGGLGVALKLKGTVVEEMVLKSPLGMKVTMGEKPKKHFGDLKETPNTRLGISALLKESLQKAKLNTKDASEEMKKVINKEIPLFVECNRHDDIMTILRIQKEFDIDLRLVSLADINICKEILVERKINCSIGSLLLANSNVEEKNRSFSGIKKLVDLGLDFCLTSKHPQSSARLLPLIGTLAVQYGISKEKALKLITLDAANHLYLSNKIGSIEEGKDADLVIWSDYPLEPTSFADVTFIEGIIKYERENVK